MYLVLSVFTSSPIPLLAIIKLCVFQEEYVCFCPIFYHLHKPKADAYHLIPSPSWFTWTPVMAYSQAKLQSSGDKMRPQTADGGTATNVEGSCDYIE